MAYRSEESSITHDFAIFLQRLKDLDLLEVYALKPLLDGRQLMTALNAKSGPWMTNGMDIVMAWQLRNPGITDTEGPIQEVKRHAERLQIQYKN